MSSLHVHCSVFCYAFFMYIIAKHLFDLSWFSQRVCCRKNGKCKSVLITAVLITAVDFAYTFIALVQVSFFLIISSLRKVLGLWWQGVCNHSKATCSGGQKNNMRLQEPGDVSKHQEQQQLFLNCTVEFSLLAVYNNQLPSIPLHFSQMVHLRWKRQMWGVFLLERQPQESY